MQAISTREASLRNAEQTVRTCMPRPPPALRPSDIPAKMSETLPMLTSLPLTILPDRLAGLFLRADLSCRQVHLHLPVLEQLQQHAHPVRAGQACIEDRLISSERPGMDRHRFANF